VQAASWMRTEECGGRHAGATGYSSMRECTRNNKGRRERRGGESVRLRLSWNLEALEVRGVATKAEGRPHSTRRSARAKHMLVMLLDG
jgi:hypothetical protein